MNIRYARNRSSLSEQEQTQLGRSHVLIAGLGGLGGFVLEQLLRLGVGHITGADGDRFEPGNLNRQLLATTATMGMNKARAAAQRAAEVNPDVAFNPVEFFLDATSLPPLLSNVHVVIDALGGLSQRTMLHLAAVEAGIPVVAAGIAGFTGWVKIIRPGAVNPVHALASRDVREGDGETVEERLGNLAPVASVAASLQAVLALHLLLERPIPESMLVFDLAEMGFYPIEV